jgi:hypothetical protein
MSATANGWGMVGSGPTSIQIAKAAMARAAAQRAQGGD